MIKNLGEGNGQDGSCVRRDKADVVALGVVIFSFFGMHVAGSRCGTRTLVKERRLDSSKIPRGLFRALTPHFAEIAMHVGQGVGCAREKAMFC